MGTFSVSCNSQMLFPTIFHKFLHSFHIVRNYFLFCIRSSSSSLVYPKSFIQNVCIFRDSFKISSQLMYNSIISSSLEYFDNFGISFGIFLVHTEKRKFFLQLPSWFSFKNRLRFEVESNDFLSFFQCSRSSCRSF